MTLHEFVELRIVDVADRAQFCLDFILIKVHVLAQCVERTIKVPEFRTDYSRPSITGSLGILSKVICIR